jgi:hypothetical protein
MALTIEISEATRMLWYQEMTNGNWMGAIEAEPGKKSVIVTYRFRYYKDKLGFDSEDEKKWYSFRVPSYEEALPPVLLSIEKGEAVFGNKAYQLFRGAGTYQQFFAEFKKAPFVQLKELKLEK